MENISCCTGEKRKTYDDRPVEPSVVKKRTKVYDLRISNPCNLFVIGPSGSGKTSFVIDLINKSSFIFKTPPKSVTICYAEMQPAYQEVKHTSPIPVRLHKSFSMELYNSLPRDSLVVLDDCLMDCADRDLNEITIRGGHHHAITQILIGHNVFLKNMRTVSLNCHKFCFFKTVRDPKQVENFGRQMSVGSKWLGSVFKACTKEAHSYLYVDVHQETPDEIRFRKNILSTLQTVFVHPDNDVADEEDGDDDD